MKTSLDRPIKTEKEDCLYYNELYAEELERILQKNQRNSVKIGFFGKFGSGKTSTINILQERLKHSGGITPQKVFIHIKSIWDYCPEDILKKILVTVDKKCNLHLGYEKSVNSETIQPQKKEMLNFFSFYLIISILTVLLLLSLDFLVSGNGSLSVETKFGEFTRMSIIPRVEMPDIIIQLIISLVTTGTIIFLGVESLKKQIRRPPATSYDFELYWKKITKALNKKCINHITLVVDDLDRCDPKIVNEIFGKLNTIVEKTEEYKRVHLTLIVPFSLGDYFSLSEGKEKNLLKNNYKKFFDYIIDMPALGRLELQRLTANGD